jgi:hypothetical protein
MITELTKAQRDKFPEYVREWANYGLCTDPADRPLAEEGIRELYSIAGLKEPKIVWATSPMANGILYAIAKGNKLKSVRDSVRVSVWDSVGASVRDSVGASVRDSVWDSVGASVRDSVWASVWASVGDSVGASVRDSVWASVGDSVGASVRDSVGASVRDSVWASVWASVGASVWDSVGASVWDSVGDSVWDSVGASVWDSVGDSVGASVWDSVGASVRDSVWASVWDSVGASVWASVGASVRDSVGASVRDSVGASVWDSVGASVWDSVGASVWASGYGQHDANWLAFYKYFDIECGLAEETKKLTGLWKVCKSAGWYLPYENVCFVSERHNSLHLDEQGRLHNPTGAALAYPDGWGVYAVHGVRLPEWIITEPEKITIENIQTMNNAEIRRVMIDKFGADRYAQSGKIIHEDEFGTLYRLEVTNDEPIVMVKVTNSTPEPDGSFKDYYLRVPPETKTAREAVAWTFGMSEQEYQPEYQS